MSSFSYISCSTSVDLRNPREFERAYRECAPVARSAAYRVLQEWGAAEDVVQEVFTALWRRPETFDPSRGPLSRYVAMMARSRAVDSWRSTRTRESATERAGEQVVDVPRVEEDATVSVERRELAGALLRGLEAAPRTQREAVLLAYGGELSSSEIAGVLGVPLGTAKSRVRLGLEKTRAALAAAA
jgi:RNA polymerase sigma-70 factor (ECF subfamily)